MPLAHASQFFGGLRLETRINAEPVNGNLARWHAEHGDHIVPARDAVSEDVIRLLYRRLNLAVVVAAAFGRQVLRVVQKRQVVNGDNVAVRAPARRDEIGGMQHIQPEAGQFDRERRSLEAVVTGRPQRRAAHSGRGGRLLRLAAAEGYEVVPGIEIGQRAQKLRDIRADAARSVGEESSVKSDTHGGQYTCRVRRLSRGGRSGKW